MTAVIGILNRSGVALAADSAVTISGGNGRKIYNSAYKIFTLSKFHPVSVMIYNAATFMGILWEILIKQYRNQLKEKSFDTLQKYQDDFIAYLKDNIHLVSAKVQATNTADFIRFIAKKTLRDISKENLDEISKERSIKGQREIIEKHLKSQIPKMLSFHGNREVLSDFTDYTFNQFEKEYGGQLSSVYDEYYSEFDLSASLKKQLFNVIHRVIVGEFFPGSWTGLVFSGYGENEIYPSCLPIKIGEVVDYRIRYMADRENVAVISDHNDAQIVPFAQRDVIDTILTGIDRNLENTIYSSFENFFSEFISFLKTEISDSSDLKNKLDKINVQELTKGYAENFQQLKRKIHIDPLMSSIGSLSKEDLADLAESLIYLTYLKRRMSFSEESVGGPIDVALLTKGDGFVWLKRKHYFDKTLNQDFIHKYLK